jgi:hypothetical protein
MPANNQSLHATGADWTTADILLANPLFLNQNEAERELMTPYFPMGLLYLASYLRERDFGVEVFDGTFTEGETAFLTKVPFCRSTALFSESFSALHQMP